KVDVVQCEVTYINDFIQGSGWNSFSEAMSLFSVWCNKGTTGFLPELESFGMNGSFLMANRKGRLHFAAQHVMRELDRKQAIQLRLTARGSPGNSEDTQVLEWLDSAREWIVRGFTDLTSE